MATQAFSPVPQKTTWSETSTSGPCALADLMIWRGVGNNQINLSAMPGDIGKWELGQTTEASPGAAFFNGLSWIAWIGTNKHLNVTTTADPSDKVTLGETSGHPSDVGDQGVALAAFNGDLYLAWAGTSILKPTLNVIRSRDGRQWRDKVTFDETSDDRPALVAFNSYLYLAWSGRDSKGHLNLMRSSDGHNFGNKQTLEFRAIAGPALADFRSRLCLAWPEDSHLALAASPNGVDNWKTVRFDESTYKSVALSVIGSNLVYCWTGTDSRLNFMNV